MRRRAFLQYLAGAVALTLPACTSPTAGQPGALLPTSGTNHGPSTSPGASGGGTRLFGPPSGIVQLPVPYGTITGLPGPGNLVALTVDDGTDTDVVGAYVDLAARTGLRLTLFANGYVPSWTDHAAVLRPLVEQGQAFVANHTWSHQDLTTISDSAIANEIQRNEQFLTNTYGVTGRPFLRPPYGNHNAHVDRVLAELGYPAVTMWYGSLGDSAILPPDRIVTNARRWLQPGRLVIGHANHPAVINVLDQIVGIIEQRSLQPVHLGDVYAAAALSVSSSAPSSSAPSPTDSIPTITLPPDSPSYTHRRNRPSPGPSASSGYRSATPSRS